MPASRTRLSQNLGVLFLSVGAALGLVEIFVRWYEPQAIYAIRYCDLGWCHVPRVDFTHGGESREFVTHVQYNSDGLRDREYPLLKAAGVRRVLVFGDSFAEGLEVEAEQLFAKRLEQALNQYSEPKVEVINFGVSAYDTAQEWQYFQKDGARYQPELVIVLWTGEAGSPYVRLANGRAVFHEPEYSQLDRLGRDIKTFIKLHFHLVSLVFDRFGLNRSVQQFQGEVDRGMGKAARDIWHLPSDQPALPFDPEWEEQMAIFEAFSRDVESIGAKLIVAARSAVEYRYLTESLTLRPISGLITVDLQQVSDEDEAAFRFHVDGHWNERGHDKAAKGLFELIVMRHLLEGLDKCVAKASPR